MSTNTEFETFKKQVTQKADINDWPHADRVEKNIVIYKGSTVRELDKDPNKQAALLSEWLAVFTSGPGVVFIEGAFENTDVIDQATDLFTQIIKDEKTQSGGGGDHFAKPGANDRIWNAVQKHCLTDPQNFIDYYSNRVIALAALAWLGDGYQMTAQVNRVNPGGAAQTPHRDYHLGFMSVERMKKFPAHVHKLSPVLTLQGAVAHVDMPLESGPTVYLPYSHLFDNGYVSFWDDEYQDYFAKHHVQLPLKKGDAVFFNPAVMHGSGNNVTTDVARLANLLQVSSAFGRAMEEVDRRAMVKALFTPLKDSNLDANAKAAVIASSAEGYAFPTNLDLDPPVGGAAPRTQADMFNEALSKNWDEAALYAALDSNILNRKA
jgi:ectoine hydroxylase-related dioxygenase (phytanoyl-CoA dioxygenase family)